MQDVDRAVGFYRDALEFEVKQQDETWAEVDANGLMIGLNGNEPDGAGVSGGPVVAFQVEDDLENAVKELEGRGVTFDTGISEHPWGRIANFNDSEGNDLQLYQPPAS
ncbi:MAG TPA: VOC family protein [Thermoleophilaceae bacterium]|nr:VOC family protein [Thermoleophilaceae bacterium]